MGGPLFDDERDPEQGRAPLTRAEQVLGVILLLGFAGAALAIWLLS